MRLLVFTKLASQLTAEKLVELAVIPVIFVVQTLVSYLISIAVSKAFGFKKRPANFVTAMGVCILNMTTSKEVSSLDFADMQIGFWKLQLITHLPRHIALSNTKRITLGQDSRRQ